MQSISERFNSKYIPEPYSQCWLWTGAVSSWGYPWLWKERRWGFAHRISWEIHRGEIPSGMKVCHKCDTPLCVNPNHLFLGTQKDNLADMTCKGRAALGERHGNHVFTNHQIEAIREAKGTQKDIAIEFGTCPSQVSRIKNRKTWKHV